MLLTQIDKEDKLRRVLNLNVNVKELIVEYRLCITAKL